MEEKDIASIGRFQSSALLILVSAVLAACGGGGSGDSSQPSDQFSAAGGFKKSEGFFQNADGIAQAFSTDGFIDTNNPFFKPFGNGRSCATCHAQEDGWSLTPASLRKRFDDTRGRDPVFRLVDGANAPHLPDGTLAERKAAYSMLLEKGVIRIGLPIPATAEFELASVDDPYGHASATELSLYRRPLPSANLGFLSAVMWDGRETFRDPTSTNCLRGTTICFASIDFDLLQQANTATKGHAEAAAGLTPEEQRAIVDFELKLFSAQIFDSKAKQLDKKGALGGAIELLKNEFYFGINDLQTGDYRTNAPFDPNVMKVFTAWKDLSLEGKDDEEKAVIRARKAIARGEVLFNTKPINITDTKGINDALGSPLVVGTCGTCHNTPNSGTRSVPLPIDIGVSAASRRTTDMPLYTLRHKTTGETIQTTDPGRALVTGRWADINKFKISALRGLAARAPYFHDGSAKTLEDTVIFYNTRFGMGMTNKEIEDMTAFLKAL